MDEFTIEFEQASPRGVAQISRPADDQVKHRLRIARRGRHRLEHVDRGGLMFDALAEFALPRRQFGTALVELALEFRNRLLGIGRIVRCCFFPPSPSMGEGWGGGERLNMGGGARLDTGGNDRVEMFGDGRAHTLGIVQHLVVPEPQHAVALGFEKPRAACFCLGRGIMLPAIDLDDQSRCVAGKVDNEPADRHLAAKPTVFGLPRPQYLPEAPLGFGHVTAEGPGALARTRTRRFFHHGSVLGITTPTPALPHRGGGCVKRVAVWYSSDSWRSLSSDRRSSEI